MDFRRHFFIALSLILIGISLFCVVDLKTSSNELQRRQFDLGELRHVKYGLLNPHEWKRKVSSAIAHKLENIDWNSTDKSDIRKQVIKVLERLFEEFDALIQNRKSEGSWLERTIRSSILDFAIDMNQLKKNIPDLADAVMEELSKPQAMENIKQLIEDKLDGFVLESVGDEDRTVIDKLLAKYEVDDIITCKHFLQSDIVQRRNKLQNISILYISSVILIFVLWLAMRDTLYRNWQWYFILGATLLMLYSGISIPMISIDARIDSLGIQLLDSDIVFEDQVLFFQSKSILDVVDILLDSKSFQNIFVGILILCFSVIFPLIKLCSLLLLRNVTHLRKYKLLQILAYRTGKWSMADVFVVAIFMAFVGFNGIIDSQLQYMTQASGSANIISTNNTLLELGVLYFAIYVIIGIFLSVLTVKHNQVYTSD